MKPPSLFKISHYQLYIKNFMISPTKMGSLFPSSRWLCDAMVSNIDWEDCLNIAEIGAGNGVMSRYIMNKITPETTLNLYEINNDFIHFFIYSA
ncbi:hypothetical protein [Providencia rustigianii]|uniref:hypothetical protein n=1 Tax=Providencia rustigianii TaxID=158850 RepID=UPI000F6E3610|nr:Phospholipid N-methyltransferase [Providencia rustigianii]